MIPLLILLQFFYAVYLLWLLSGWLKARALDADEAIKPDGEIPFVTVLIAFRNEKDNLRRLLQSLQQQSYPAQQTEWILINDHSDDGGELLLNQFQNHRLRVINLQNGLLGKKAALEAGLKEARGEWILCSDADCILPHDWIQAMVMKGMSSPAEMVCGRVALVSDGSVLQEFQAMETMLLQNAAAGSLYYGFPLLNTGASLAYRRSSLSEAGAYNSNADVASGDDTFLMLDFQRRFPGFVKPCTNPGAMVMTPAERTWSSVLVQRKRRQSKVWHYPPCSIHLVGLLMMCSSMAVLAMPWLLIAGFCPLWYYLLALAFRLVPEWLLLKAEKSAGFSPLSIIMMSVFYPFFNLFCVIISPLVSSGWKGRKL